MEMKKYYDDIFKVLIQDEELLRLLYYKPVDRLDNPLNGLKPNIKTLPEDEYWAIIDDRIVSAPKFNDIEKPEDDPKCRLFFYLGYGNQGNNPQFFKQEIVFEVFVHFDYENMDRRTALICDRLHKIINFKAITGMGKTKPVQRKPIPAPNDYIGYSLIYEISTENY
jgi:hypothetical protein